MNLPFKRPPLSEHRVRRHQPKRRKLTARTEAIRIDRNRMRLSKRLNLLPTGVWSAKHGQPICTLIHYPKDTPGLLAACDRISLAIAYMITASS